MNEEEALEIFKNLILLPYDWKITDKYKGTINFIGAIEGNEAIQIILNLIKKLQEENKELNNRCKNLDEEAQAYVEELMGDSTLKDRIINRLNKENKELKEDLKYVLNQTLGAFEKNWCIDWNFTEIREKYNLESE